jgi:hypothetical protein
MKCPAAFVVASVFLAAAAFAADETEEGFVPLMDGKTFTDWKASEENPDTWKLEDGAFVCRGERNHLFYVGDEAPFKNFELKVDVMTEPGSNGGIYFHTAYQAKGWPVDGFETQVNNTQSDWRKTGSIYALASVGFSLAEDNKWWTQHVIVNGNKVMVKINGKICVEYIEPPGVTPGADFRRKFGQGTFALQGHDPKSIVHYKNIRVKRLPD